MRILIRSLPVALAASLLVLIAIACKSGGSQSNRPDLVSADPAAVLDESAENFQQEVDSLQAELLFSMNIGGFDMNASAEMAFQAPGEMHATMEVTGLGTFEMLLLGADLYMNIPGQGWVQISLDDAGLSEFGLDAATLQDVMTDHSLVDYQGLIESLGAKVDDLGEETVDGGPFRHYRTTTDFADIAAAFSDAFGATSDLGLDSLSGPLTLDFWVDPNTTLPYRIDANGELAFGEGSMVFDGTMLFFGYNEPVGIPAAPPDAVPFALLGGP